jgi:hypothetical protein
MKSHLRHIPHRRELVRGSGKGRPVARSTQYYVGGFDDENRRYGKDTTVFNCTDC